MAPIDDELLAVVERSPTATDAHDRADWVGLFTADGRVEDPYGSRPHVGHEEIGRFYDTFIAPRRIVYHRDVDMAVDAAVVRDITLEIAMGDGVTLDVPMHLRYDLRRLDTDWTIERLRAHWELPTMVAQMLRQGRRALPVSARLGAELFRNQGLGGTAGFLSGFKRPGRRQKRCVERFLDAAVAGDQVTSRRLMRGAAAVSVGEQIPISVGELVDRVRGGRWFKMIAAGDTVSASIDTPAGRCVVFCEIPSRTSTIGRIRYFA